MGKVFQSCPILLHIILLLTELVEFLHGFYLDFVCHVNIRFHGLVVAVAGPLHDDLWRYSHAQGIADERPSTRVCTDQFVFGLHDVNSLVPLIIGLSDWLVKTSQLAQFVKIYVHLLIADYSQVLMVAVKEMFGLMCIIGTLTLLFMLLYDVQPVRSTMRRMLPLRKIGQMIRRESLRVLRV